MVRKYTLNLEELENRAVPATFGIPWPNPSHLTLSFAPDGTQVGNERSQLFGLLNAVAPTQTWQNEIVRAFQTWAEQTNINLSVVSDSGDPLGTVGPIQSDSRFGDIRITAVPLPSDVVGFTMPFDATAGSWAGDVELNSNYAFGIGSSAAYDLFSVALHEAGHAFGIDESTDPTSAMYSSFTGIRTGLSDGDISSIQALYGTRTPDTYDAASNNGTLSTATAINLSSGGNGLAPVLVQANIASPTDVDVYSIKPGNNQTGLTVDVQTSNISLLLPSLMIYSGDQTVMASAVATDHMHGDLSIHLSNLQPGATYYLQIAPATSDAFAAGSYRLQIVPDGVAPLTISSGSSVAVLPDDAHTNDTPGTSTDLRQSAFQTDTRYAFAVQSGISDSTDVDYYHLRAPQGPNGTITVMRVIVWGTDVGGLDPVVSVFDAQGNAVAADVLVNENGSYVVQVANAVPNTDYYVAVRAENPSGLQNTGNYFLGVDFGSQQVNLQSFTSGTLSQSSRDDFRTLQVNQSQLFHMVMSVDSGQVPVGTAVKMTIYDQSGNVISALTALNGETQSLTLFLAPGTYTVRFAGNTTDGSPLPATNYVLRGVSLSDPIGPTSSCSTLSPTTTTTTTSTTGTSLDYYWLQYSYYTFLSLAGYP
jgi:matrixin